MAGRRRITADDSSDRSPADELEDAVGRFVDAQVEIVRNDRAANEIGRRLSSTVPEIDSDGPHSLAALARTRFVFYRQFDERMALATDHGPMSEEFAELLRESREQEVEALDLLGRALDRMEVGDRWFIERLIEHDLPETFDRHQAADAQMTALLAAHPDLIDISREFPATAMLLPTAAVKDDFAATRSMTARLHVSALRHQLAIRAELSRRDSPEAFESFPALERTIEFTERRSAEILEGWEAKDKFSPGHDPSDPSLLD